MALPSPKQDSGNDVAGYKAEVPIIQSLKRVILKSKRHYFGRPGDFWKRALFILEGVMVTASGMPVIITCLPTTFRANLLTGTTSTPPTKHFSSVCCELAHTAPHRFGCGSVTDGRINKNRQDSHLLPVQYQLNYIIFPHRFNIHYWTYTKCKTRTGQRLWASLHKKLTSFAILWGTVRTPITLIFLTVRGLQCLLWRVFTLLFIV